jgi:hypothetical protein
MKFLALFVYFGKFIAPAAHSESGKKDLFRCEIKFRLRKDY